MIRLDEKSKLIMDCCDLYSKISRYSQCLPTKLIKVANKSILKDFMKGLKEIDKKNPVYVEMPELKSEGNGMYSENYANSDPPDCKEIIVSSTSVVSTTKD